MEKTVVRIRIGMVYATHGINGIDQSSSRERKMKNVPELVYALRQPKVR